MPGVIHQIIPTLRRGDAVGDTALRTRQVLRDMGYTSEIYRERCETDLRDESLPAEAYLEASDSGNLVIFHYSIGSELGRFVYALPDRVILWYHNITPPEYFIGVHDHVVGELYHGRKQVEQFAGRVLLAAGGSEYNRAELEAMGFAHTTVLPYAIRFDHLDGQPDPFVMDSFADHRRNFLFVGRVVPNKGLEDLIKLYAHYKKYVSHDSRLLIVGDWSGFERYRLQLLKLIDGIDLPHVVMTGRADLEQLRAFYRLADVYVSLSRHEGFCVPLLEAMHFDVPVLARAAAAVPETMDDAGVLINDLDYAEAAEMLDILANPGPFRERVLRGQRQRLERFKAVPFEKHLERVVAMAQELVRRGGGVRR
jgi:L-malate glycosyltransferase